MASAKSPPFEELTKLATEFVTRHRGLWDHQAWSDFVAHVRDKGFDISEDMQAKLGELLEAIKQFYTAAASTESIENAMRDVVSDSVAFIKHHDGVWGHSEWEEFVKTVQQNTLTLSEGTASYLGGVLESIRVFYRLPLGEGTLLRRPSAPAALPAAEAEPAPAAPTPPDAQPDASPAALATGADAPGGEAGAAAAALEVAASSTAAAVPVESEVVRREAQDPRIPPPAEAPAIKAEPGQPKVAARVEPATKAAPKKPSRKPPIQRDDLTAIGGIGPVLAKKLNDAGIFSYAQLAALSQEDIEHLEKNIIKYSGRIRRDDWVGQARKLL